EHCPASATRANRKQIGGPTAAQVPPHHGLGNIDNPADFIGQRVAAAQAVVLVSDAHRRTVSSNAFGFGGDRADIGPQRGPAARPGVSRMAGATSLSRTD